MDLPVLTKLGVGEEFYPGGETVIGRAIAKSQAGNIWGLPGIEPRTKQEMYRLWTRAMMVALLGGIAIGGIPTIVRVLRQTTEAEKPNYDIDVDVPFFEGKEDKKASYTPEGLFPGRPSKFDYVIPLALLTLASGAGGIYLGDVLADRLALNKLDNELAQAEKRYNEALAKQLLAGREGKLPGPFAPYKKGSQKQAKAPGQGLIHKIEGLIRGLPPLYWAYFAAALPLTAYLFGREEAEKSPKYLRWQEALDAMAKRTTPAYPHAQLVEFSAATDEDLKKKLRNWAKEYGLKSAI